MKEIIDHLVSEALRDLVDAAYQHRVWVEGRGTEVSTMNETASALFDDSGLETALEKNVVTFSTEIDRKFRELQSMLASCLKRQTNEQLEDILASPQWYAVRRRAEELLTKLADRGRL